MKREISRLIAESEARNPPEEFPSLRRRRWKHGYPEWPERYEIIQGLLRLRRAGYFTAVYVDCDRLRVTYPLDQATSELTRLSWHQASALTADRKPALSERAPHIQQQENPRLAKML